MNVSPHARVHAQVLLSRVLVATSFTVGAAITHGMEPLLLIWLRFAIATLLLAPFVHWRHGLSLPSAAALLRYSAISASIIGFFWAMFVALRYTEPINAAAIHTLVPGISAVYAVLLVRERLRTRQLVALGFGLVGALWVVFRGDPARAAALQIGSGDLIFFLGCLSMGLYTPLISLFHRGEPAAVMSLWVLATGTLWLALINNVAIVRLDWQQVEFDVYAGIVYLAVFTTLLTFYIQQHATPRLGPTRVAAYTYLTPLLVVMLEWLGGHGIPDLSTLLGVLIILAATIVVQRGPGRGV
ncbi:MAG: DMT family transporter [Gammaproteobacteria bacterium]|nr:DMT family transporter [Gammaproteobacteria bacterium]